MRKLMWFAVGFVCACLLAVYALPEGWLLWTALAAVLIAAVMLFPRHSRSSNAPHPPQCAHWGTSPASRGGEKEGD